MLTALERDQTQLLLNKVAVIDFKYQKTRQKRSFNVFSLLGKTFDEVHLHSKFIHELLDPKGSHGYGKLFLDLFLTQLKFDDFDTDGVVVHREYKCIDLLVKNQKQAIVIENKIYAVDQYQQLQRYYETMLSEGITDIKVIYLTIDGKEPEEHSIGHLATLSNWQTIFSQISYEYDISEWIQSCIKEAYNLPTLRETLIQYKSLINKIAGKTMNNEERNDILQLLAEGDNIKYAKKIAENWIHVQWHTEWDFWNELQSVAEKEYSILNRNKYSSDRLDTMYHKSRNRNPWYGVMFKINEFNGYDVCLFVERGLGDVYYGVTAIKDDDREGLSKNLIFDELAKAIEIVSEWERESSWLGGRWCEPRINFEQFSSPQTLKLLNPTEREKYVNNLWVSIKNYIYNVNDIIARLEQPA